VVDLDATNYNTLVTYSNASNFNGCNALFSTDSWVPSNSANTSYPDISCLATNGNTGTATTCTASLANNGANTCGGCMDSYQLETIITTGANLGTALTTRYTAGCSTFITGMSNIWTNYYVAKATILSGVLSRATTVTNTITSTGAGGLNQALTTMGTLFSSINSSLSSIATLTDPTYGLIAGLNCLVFGEDFQRIENVLCGSLYNNFYVMRFAIGISCYGVLFAMCCIVCTGVRHYKHGERKHRIGDAFFGKSD